MYKEIIDPHGNKGYVTMDRLVFFDIAISEIGKGAVVLDVGCGDASFATKAGSPNMHLLDRSPTTVAELVKTFKNAKEGEATKLPYADSFFDVIHTSHLVEHLQPEEVYAFMKECRRCIKPGGKLIISAPVLWKGFYSDLSHIKPYNPEVFIGYLCSRDSTNHTRALIGGFSTLRLVGRYAEDSVINKDTGTPFTAFVQTGYTLVLKKL